MEKNIVIKNPEACLKFNRSVFNVHLPVYYIEKSHSLSHNCISDRLDDQKLKFDRTVPRRETIKIS